MLSFLARHQASEVSPFSDSEPGKIMHETRKGEMAVLRELPFGRYYGGVDTTPLYIYLAVSYADRTGDMAFIDRMWDSLCGAAAWMEEVGARNGHGFVTYRRAAEFGLSNQGWKDSSDAIFHADGRIPAGPIALVEVQGYVFAAYQGPCGTRGRRGEEQRAAHWAALGGQDPRRSVEEHFWMEDAGYYALAIDGEGQQCARARLECRPSALCRPAARRSARNASSGQLLSAQFHSGWGMQHACRRRDPVQPDVLPQRLDLAARYRDLRRRPCPLRRARQRREADERNVRGGRQLQHAPSGAVLRFHACGWARRPVAYPVACLPQAWSAGSVFMLMQACLGIRVDGWRGEISVDRPRLPIGIDNLVIRHLDVGDAKVDIIFERIGDRVVLLSRTIATKASFRWSSAPERCEKFELQGTSRAATSFRSLTAPSP